MSTVERVTIEKKTDQLNFEDFLGGVTRTVTIAGVTKGTKEQQYDIHIEGDPRVWRPAVTVLKILVAAWGDDAREWVGRRAQLFGDPTVTFGRERVGGIRVSHLSHIDERLTISLQETRGKKAAHVIDPLPEASPEAIPEALRDQALRGIAEAADVETVTRVLRWAESQGIDVVKEATDRREAIKVTPADDSATTGAAR